MKYLGIDYGDKKIGLALGDDGSHVAVPLEVVCVGANGRSPVQRITEIIREEQIDEVVVGVPLPTVDAVGTIHELSVQRVRDWIQKLQAEISVPVHETDERYTTAEAIRSQKESGATAEEDAIAAAIILQAWFDEGEKVEG